MKIGDRRIGVGSVYVIAEIGVNHDGSPDRALEMIDACAQAGTDAVKLQSFRAERLMSAACRLAKYQSEAGENDPREMLDRLQLSPDELGRCVERAHEEGVHAIVTPFTVGDLNDVIDFAWDAYKTASPDVINRPLLDAVAGEGKPMIVSTGASTIDEVTRAARWLEDARERICFLQCVSAYPTPTEHAALGGIADIARATGLPTGYSDHTTEVATGALAVVAGACVLEKHVTHDRGASGPDHKASLTFEEFASYAQLAREASMMTREGKSVLEVERDVRAVSRQSIVTVRAIEAGETVTRGMLTIKRPGTGIEPWAIDDVIGRRASRRVEADMPVSLEDLA